MEELINKVRKCFDDDVNLNSWKLDKEFGEENWYALTHYTAWPDERGGDLLALHIKYKGKYFCILVYNKDMLNLKEIDKEIFEEDKPF